MAFISSLLSGFYLIAGPFVSALANRYGFRMVTMIGAILAAICFSVSYFATGVIFMYIIYGVIGGLFICYYFLEFIIHIVST